MKDFLKKYGEDMRKEISKEDYDKLYPGMAEMFKQHHTDCDCAICDDIRMTEELEKLSSFRSGVRSLADDVINRYGRIKNPMPWQKELLEIARKITENKSLTT